jgi:hypothetical protein
VVLRFNHIAIAAIYHGTTICNTFLDAQRATNPPGQRPLAGAHNVATRWSSDYVMANRAPLLQPALQKLFVSTELEWINCGRNPHQRPEILSYMLTDLEWEVVKCLQHILKRFTIAIDQL